MSSIVKIEYAEVEPKAEDVLAHQGIPADRDISARTVELLNEALEKLEELGESVAITCDISSEEFQTVFRAEGENEPEAPLKDIFPQSQALSLYSATMGKSVSEEIQKLFADNDFARAIMLDSAASIAAGNTSEFLEKRLMEELNFAGHDIVLGYSPGYCGWHITAQGALFRKLKPEQIGISLNNSYLMQPLKSVSGVLVAGKKEIHRFKPKFRFCGSCRNHTCLERMRKVISVGEKGEADGNPEAIS